MNMKNTLGLNQNLNLLNNGYYYDINPVNNTLIISEGVTHIIPEMFKNIPSVITFDTIQIPSSVISIGRKAFEHIRVKRLIIPEGVKYIEDEAFGDMQETEEIYFPSSLLQIGYFAMCIDRANIKKLVIGNPDMKFGNSFFPKGMTHEMNNYKCENNVGYKAFNCLKQGLNCRDYFYKEGETYEMAEEPLCCVKGFHFCTAPVECFKYYNGFYNNFNNDYYTPPIVVHEVFILGDVNYDLFSDRTKGCTNKIKIGRSLTLQECFDKSIEIWQNISKK